MNQNQSDETTTPSPRILEEVYVLNEREHATALITGMAATQIIEYDPQCVHRARVEKAANGVMIKIWREEAPPPAPIQGPPDLVGLKNLLEEAMPKQLVPSSRQIRSWDASQIQMALRWAGSALESKVEGLQLPPLPAFMEKPKRGRKPKDAEEPTAEE